MKMQKKTVKRILLITFAVVLTLALAVLAYAYFSTRAYVVSSDGTKEFARLGMELNTFFDKLTVDPGTDIKILNKTTSDETDTYKFDPTAEWGSPENPYIISELRHLRNLSVLQNIGYFELKEDGAYEERMPYFLVCKPDGTPVVIDGTGMADAYEPIGNNDHPFIGYVGGAFTEGTASRNDGETVEALKNSDQSVIYNVTIKPKEDFVDIGLFGCISYNGNRADAEDDTKLEFEGAPSVVSNLLLYDVTVKVEEPSTWTKIADAVGHLFNFGKTSAEKLSTPHENHHIGILAGHVEYATVEYISVYYSNEDTPAIDITHVKPDTNGAYANYMSNSGIIGFVYNMNCTSGEGKIKKDGTDNSDLEVSTGGAGSGGGSLSGLGRGYVAAKDIFENYDDSGVAMYYEIDEIPYYSLLVIKNGNNYELEDGTTVTINAAGDATITTTYRDFFNIRRTTVTTWKSFVVKDGDTYKHRNQTTVFSKAPEKSGIYLRYAKQYSDDEWKALCTQYERDRIIWGEQAVDRYYFYDGVFTFALSSGTDKVEPTWEGDVDQMVLGSTNAADWKTNNSKGNRAIAAYVKKITNNADLDAAISAGKKLFIMYDLGGNNQFVMTLQDQSTAGDGTPDVRYSTPGEVMTFDNELAASLVESFEGGYLDLPTNAISYSSVSAFSNDIKTGKVQVINLGTATENKTLTEVENRYNITATKTGAYSYFYDNGSGAEITEGQKQIYDFYNFQGYFYYTQERSGGNQEYSYYYQPAAGGDPITLTEGVYNPPNSSQTVWFTRYEKYFSSVQNFTVAGNTFQIFTNGDYSGILLDTDMELFNTDTKVTTNNGTATVQLTGDSNKYYYFLVDINGNTVHSQNNTAVSLSNLTLLKTSSGGQKIYSYNGLEGFLIYKYPTYTLSNGENFIRIMSLNYVQKFLGFTISNNTYYAMWNGTDSYAASAGNFEYNNITPTVNNNKNCAIIFNNDANGSAYLKFVYGSDIKYVNYNNSKFIGTDNNSSSTTKISIYSLEGTQKINGGQVTYEPKSNAIALDANRYVLWPNSTTDLNNGATSGRTANPSYTVKEIQLSGIEPTVTNTDVDLLKSSAGWKNSQGGTLTKADLGSKFTLDAGIDSRVLLADLFNGETGVGSSNYVRAPIGSTGEESFIPTGCVAFRVNADGDNKARVIVAMPTTEYYYNEKDNDNKDLNPLDYNEDYYFGIWRIAAAGDSLLTSVNLGNARSLFELPRSNTYEPGTSAGATYVEGTNNFYNVSYNGTQYRTYFNGERILVAYEFDVNEEGVYIMGSSKQCDIVYFSVDATASAGGDGESSYKMGTIDYVYDDGNGKVLTVKDVDPRDKTVAGYTRDYTKYYYNSYSIMYTQNIFAPVEGDTDFTTQTDSGTTYKFPNVNNVEIYLQRKLNGTPTIYWRADRADKPYITTVDYSLLSDIIVKRETTP